MIDLKNLYNLAKSTSEKSYSPYSRLKVGAVVLCKNDEYFLGTNIENAAYGSTMCAERVAIYNAYTQGVKKDDIIALAIYADKESFSFPCGSCLQVLSELCNNDIRIVLFNNKGDSKSYLLNELSTHPFTL